MEDLIKKLAELENAAEREKREIRREAKASEYGDQWELYETYYQGRCDMARIARLLLLDALDKTDERRRLNEEIGGAFMNALRPVRADPEDYQITSAMSKKFLDSLT